MDGKLGKAVSIAAIFLCVAVVSVPAAQADGGGYSGEKSFFDKVRAKFSGKKCGKKKTALWWKNSKMVERLELTDEQGESLDGIAESYREKVSEAYETVSEKKNEYKELMASGDATSRQIKAAAEKKYDAARDKKMLKLDMRLEMREVLTPEQRKTLAEIKSKKWGKKKCGGRGGKY